MASETNQQKISVVLHLVVGIIAGYLSLLVGSTINAVSLGIIILILTGFATQKSVGKGKKMSWWFGNGGIIYLFIWIISWILFFNLF